MEQSNQDISKNPIRKVGGREMRKEFDADGFCVILFLVVTVSMILLERLS